MTLNVSITGQLGRGSPFKLPIIQENRTDMNKYVKINYFPRLLQRQLSASSSFAVSASGLFAVSASGSLAKSAESADGSLAASMDGQGCKVPKPQSEIRVL